MDDESLSLFTMLIGLAGGLAVFLHGMTMMSTNMRAMAGSRLKSIMASLARNRFSALLSGAAITAVVQSSSVTSVIAIGFVSAGVLNLGQALAVMMGASVGSTLTAQIIAFDISNLAFLLVAGGFGLSMWKSRRMVGLAGSVILGLGLVFIGLTMMSGFMAPLRSYQPFLDLIASMTNPLLGILVGALFTAIVQSSSATLGVIIALAIQGLIPLDVGIALVLGANIGTTITGMLATIGQPRTALQAALGLLCFKLILVLIWLPLMGPLEQITRAVSPASEALVLAEQLSYEVPRQVANVHLIVNMSTVLLLLPFTHLLAALILRVTGGVPTDDKQEPAASLNPVLLEVPPMAVDAVRREVVHMGERVAEQLDVAIRAILSDQKAAMSSLHENEFMIDRHHAAIIGFSERILQPELPGDVARAAIELVEAADYLESIGNLVDREMIPLYQRHGEHGGGISPHARERLQALADAISQELRRALAAVSTADMAQAQAVLEDKPQIRSLERAAIESSLEARGDDTTQRELSRALERELAESLRRAYSLTRRFVRVGTGLLRAGMPGIEAQGV